MFLKHKPFYGMDNIFIGNINTMYNISHKFNYNLDKIMIMHKDIYSQEFLIFYVNDNIKKCNKIYTFLLT